MNIKISKKDINKVVLDDFDVVIIPCCKKIHLFQILLAIQNLKK